MSEQIFNGAVDFMAGFADSITFGATDAVRGWMGVNESVLHSSDWYLGGELVEVGAEMVLTGGSTALGKLAAKKGAAQFRNEAVRATRRMRESGKHVHHTNTLKGHPGRSARRFPLGGLSPSIHSGGWNLTLLNPSTHYKWHSRARRLEDITDVLFNWPTIGIKTTLDFYRWLKEQWGWAPWCP